MGRSGLDDPYFGLYCLLRHICPSDDRERVAGRRLSPTQRHIDARPTMQYREPSRDELRHSDRSPQRDSSRQRDHSQHRTSRSPPTQGPAKTSTRVPGSRSTSAPAITTTKQQTRDSDESASSYDSRSQSRPPRGDRREYIPTPSQPSRDETDRYRPKPKKTAAEKAKERETSRKEDEDLGQRSMRLFDELTSKYSRLTNRLSDLEDALEKYEGLETRIRNLEKPAKYDRKGYKKPWLEDLNELEDGESHVPGARSELPGS